MKSALRFKPAQAAAEGGKRVSRWGRDEMGRESDVSQTKPDELLVIGERRERVLEGQR